MKEKNSNELSSDHSKNALKKVFNKETLPYWLGAIIVLSIISMIILYFSEAQIPTVFTSSGIVAIISALIGVILTVAVTSILLNQQSETQEKLLQEQSKAQEKLLQKQSKAQEELQEKQTKAEKEKDKVMKIFEEKLKIYKEFLSTLHEVVTVTENKISDNDIKKLIFQISYVAMHTSSKRVNNILSNLTKTIEEIGRNDKKYEKLANFILDIVLEMQQELYEEMLGESYKNTLRESEIDTKIFDGLVTSIEEASEVQQSNEVVDINKVEIQTYFWTELIEQLKKKNYDPIWKGQTSIEQDVAKYYTISRPRHRYFGFEFNFYPSKSGKNVKFSVNLDNEYCYGFLWSDNKNDEKLTQIVKQVSSKYNSNQLWGGWRWPDYSEEKTRHDLNFWKFIQHSGMKRLLDQSKREELMKDIANEMDEQIRKFREIAQKNNL